MGDLIIVTREEPIAVVQLNRPDALNALNSELLAALADALESFDRDPAIRCIVVAGSDKAFAAGADIKSSFDATPIAMTHEALGPSWARIRMVRTPLIAAVSGFALGGGCELAMLCDLIVASESAQFGQPEVNLGLMPGAGGTQRLTKAVGKFVANDMILTGRFMSAAEAKAIGLASRVFPAATWLEDAKSVARTIAAKAPAALELALEATEMAQGATLDDGLRFERSAFALLFSTDDKKEGVEAFINKRKPIFRGT